jgi:hypothetical protein
MRASVLLWRVWAGASRARIVKKDLVNDNQGNEKAG